MGVHRIHHVTLAVADVARAERAYRDVFGLDVLFREGTYDGEFGALPDGMDWETATAAGVDPGMTFLGREDAAIAVAEVEDATESTEGEATGSADGDAAGPLGHVALHVDADDVAAIAARARDRGWDVDERETAAFVVDHDGIEWEVNASSPPPATPFDALDLDAR
ncbi:VOC family protein [Halorubellus sp. JP-L1]|uniref:VOC family protein n=1 Tax=Halorubellus sp. JP-L1 TaxID=2715753 RepID=UPI00140CCB57|nr:VOC family protein [Halorubellus sp. JP-L1]NHN41696.1 VOC family protein [Halorubellus sp. JP-L1]